MNILIINLYFMMVSFYWLDVNCFKIIMEAGVFFFDQYVVESQVKWYGFSLEEVIVEVQFCFGEDILCIEDIIVIIEEYGV